MTETRPRPLVLLASREPGDLKDLEIALYSAGYLVVTARTEHETIEKVRTHPPDAVVLDDDLSLASALLKEASVSPAAPIILLRRGIPPHRLAEQGSGGEVAWDIHPLPPDSEELLLRLRVYLQAKLEIDKLNTECLIDRGSGLYNEHGFTQRAAELAALVTRQGNSAACVVFRPAAPLPSPGSGDKLGRAFKSAGRLSDAIGRTAAAEFAVFAPATNELSAIRLLRRMQDHVSHRGGVPLRAGFSAAQPARKVEARVLLERARNALAS